LLRFVPAKSHSEMIPVLSVLRREIAKKYEGTVDYLQR